MPTPGQQGDRTLPCSVGCPHCVPQVLPSSPPDPAQDALTRVAGTMQLGKQATHLQCDFTAGSSGDLSVPPPPPHSPWNFCPHSPDHLQPSRRDSDGGHSSKLPSLSPSLLPSSAPSPPSLQRTCIPEAFVVKFLVKPPWGLLLAQELALGKDLVPSTPRTQDTTASWESLSVSDCICCPESRVSEGPTGARLPLCLSPWVRSPLGAVRE